MISFELFDLKKIILKYQNELEIKNKQLIFLLKLIVFHSHGEFNISNFSKEFNYSEEELDEIISSLMTLNILKLKMEKKNRKNIKFSFEPMFNKINDILKNKEENLTDDEKIKFIIDKINLESSALVFDTIRKWLEKGMWKKLQKITQYIEKEYSRKTSLEKFDWSLFYSIVLNFEDKILDNQEALKIILKEKII